MASIAIGEFFDKRIPRGADEPVVRRWLRAGVVPSILTAYAEGHRHLRAFVSEDLPGTGLKTYEQVVDVVWKPLHFGGARPAFVCPNCGRPVRALHLHRTLSLRCARCAQLRYASRSPGYAGGGVARVRSLRARLGGPTIPGAPLPLKPRGMHERTYQRLIDEICEIEEALFPEDTTFRGMFAARERAMILARRAEQELAGG